MEEKPCDVYSEDSNYAVIRPPGRNFPGAVVQGDNLADLCRLALDLSETIRDGKAQGTEFRHKLQGLTNRLVGRMLHYQEVLDAHGIAYPHMRPLSKDDLVDLGKRKKSQASE